jgi:TonB family protein
MHNMAALRNVYSRRLHDNPNLNGKVSIKFAISESGEVISAAVAESTINDAVLDSTVLSGVMNWRFEKIDKPGDTTEVTYPFVFFQ